MGLGADLLREADFCARREERLTVTRVDVEHAIDAQIYRVSRQRERLLEEMERDTLHIDTTGAVVGQINGLSVIPFGDQLFGRPNRITARISMGKGNVVDIEREVALGESFHAKGVLILAGYLRGRYARHVPLSLSASLVFEQSHTGIGGDSASLAELCALLSAIAEVPLRQSLAVTGSVDQHGRVQAIGAVNEKIEGFFDVCRQRGLTREQGVIIPAANDQHLMLRHDVLASVDAGDFHIYPVRTVDEAMEVLTGLEAGQVDAEGRFPPHSLNGRICSQIEGLARRRQNYAPQWAAEGFS